jgi:hypothetical protein
MIIPLVMMNQMGKQAEDDSLVQEEQKEEEPTILRPKDICEGRRRKGEGREQN